MIRIPRPWFRIVFVVCFLCAAVMYGDIWGSFLQRVITKSKNREQVACLKSNITRQEWRTPVTEQNGTVVGNGTLLNMHSVVSKPVHPSYSKLDNKPPKPSSVAAKSDSSTTRIKDEGTPTSKPTPKPTPKPKLKSKQDPLTWAKAIHNYLVTRRNRCTDFERANKNRATLQPESQWCPCIPPGLKYRPVSFTSVPLNETEAANPEVSNGGHWEPKNCTARTRLAIIIPFRDRHAHLRVLLKHLHPILQAQMANYTIVVVEQNWPKVFNKASLMNIGFAYVKENLQPDCVVFHDVDLIPEDSRHFYACRKDPLHLGAYHSRHYYRLIYSGIFGAVTAFQPETFEKINGFSNRFFGWGGEDDDMSLRLKERKIYFHRNPRQVAGYKVMQHRRDHGNLNPNRGLMLNILYRDRDTAHDGLNSLKYKVTRVEKYPLYTWVLANVLNTSAKVKPTASLNITENSRVVSIFSNQTLI